MNTRNFIRSLVIGCAAPTIFIPHLESVKWKRSANEARNLWIPNPEWEVAEYRITFAFAQCIENTKACAQFYKDYLNLTTKDPIFINRFRANQIKLSV